MTNEEAIRELRHFTSVLVEADCEEDAINGEDLYSFRMSFTTEFIDVIQEAISALEKQTPEKPIWHVLSKYKNGNVKKGAWKCPTCLRIEYVKQRDALDTYCGFCGQKIDYEGVEE